MNITTLFKMSPNLKLLATDGVGAHPQREAEQDDYHGPMLWVYKHDSLIVDNMESVAYLAYSQTDNTFIALLVMTVEASDLSKPCN